MHGIRVSAIVAAFLAIMLVVAACNGDDDATDPADTDTAPVTDVTPETDDAAVTDDDDATPAVDDDTTPVTDDDDATPATADDATPVTDDDATPVTDDDATPVTDDDDVAVVDEDVDQILENAAERAEELETVRFELDGTGYIEVEDLGEVSLSNAEGAVERPDRAQVEFDIDVAGMQVPLTVVSIDGEVYFTDVFSGAWHSAPEEFQFNPAVIFSSDEGIPALIREVEDAEVLGTEQIDGREAYHIYGVISEDTIRTGTAGTFQAEDDVEFNVWIDMETYDILQIRAEDPTEETDSVWEMRIFDHDEPVEIEDPDVGTS